MPFSLKQLALKLAPWLPGSLRRALRQRYYLRIVKDYAESDWEWTPFVKPLVPSGSLILDVGANVGYLSGLFARWVGPSGRVVSVEPIPATYDALSYSMKKLFPKTVTAIQACVSDQPGEVTMAVPAYEGGGANYYESHIVEADSHESGQSFTVEATTLDLLLPPSPNNPNRNPPPPSLIKIDVEGHELAVIRGGTGFFARHQPPLLIEVAGDPDQPESSAAWLFSTLADWGYQPYLIKEGQLLARQAGDQSVDYLFLSHP
ncbi:MAG TPA: FkbM family methyltransferase [Kiritimatiellia bacterium]|nr:FkbM family methyltransferase [Kiritimatiellia bacterium]